MPELIQAAPDETVVVSKDGRQIKVNPRPMEGKPLVGLPEWPFAALFVVVVAAALWFGRSYVHPALLLVLVIAGVIAVVLGGIAILVVARILLPPRLDLVKGELVYGWPGFRTRRRFANLVAVQMLTESRNAETKKYIVEFAPKPSVKTLKERHQVNLVFADTEDDPRFAMSCFDNTLATRAFGVRIADMLKVSLIDQLDAVETAERQEEL